MQYLGTEYVPKLDESDGTAVIKLEPGLSLKDTDAFMKDMEKVTASSLSMYPCFPWWAALKQVPSIWCSALRLLISMKRKYISSSSLCGPHSEASADM